METTDPILDPLVHLAYVAAVTERLELGTGIVILPQRNLLVRVKQAASLAVLSGGRLLLGIGAGYLERSERGGRTDEYLGAVTALWTQQAPAHRGRYVDFDHVDAHPRPQCQAVDRHPVAAQRRFALGGTDQVAPDMVRQFLARHRKELVQALKIAAGFVQVLGFVHGRSSVRFCRYQACVAAFVQEATRLLRRLKHH